MHGYILSLIHFHDMVLKLCTLSSGTSIIIEKVQNTDECLGVYSISVLVDSCSGNSSSIPELLNTHGKNHFRQQSLHLSA
jgi:hypothetical protein